MALHFVRATIIAVLAITLAGFPAGVVRALAPAAVSLEAAPHMHEGTGHGQHHTDELAANSSESFPEVAVRVVDEGSAKEGCAATCCGFACHAFEPAFVDGLSTPLVETGSPALLNDDQVGNGLPYFIERPPRSI